jgi:hypothetical protein
VISITLPLPLDLFLLAEGESEEVEEEDWITRPPLFPLALSGARPSRVVVAAAK